MDRITIVPRVDWQKKVEDCGLIWHSVDNRPYWNESAYYHLTKIDYEKIKAATEACYEMFLAAGDHILSKGLLHLFGIPEAFHSLIATSWEESPPCLNYGRFDFAYTGTGYPKLLEFNCDTPTSLLEASVVQWKWKEEVFPSDDQFNSIHESLVAKWRDIIPSLHERFVHFTMASELAGEDAITVAYMADIAREAGVEDAIVIPIESIGWDGENFVDARNVVMASIYKLYPWEWLTNEEFGTNILIADWVQWIEPIWKMIWSSKAILPILYQLFPSSPYILGASTSRPANTYSYVRKPLVSREGANVTIVKDNVTIAQTSGEYDSNGYIYQELADLPEFSGNYPIIGSWIVDGQACGVGIREGGLITDNTSRFVPHVLRG